MASLALQRLLQAIISFFIVSLIVFVFTWVSGDPVLYHVREDATPEQIETTRELLGLNRPLPVQYFSFLSHAVRGDFGRSLTLKRPVNQMIRERMPQTFQLAGLAAAISIAVAVPLGVLAALNRGTILDSGAKALALLGQSIPTFWLALILIVIFGVKFQILPFAGRGTPEHFILPAITAAWASMAGMLRITRSSMLEVIGSDYVRTARAKGLRERAVIWRHAFRNALIPIVTSAALLLGGLLNGVTLVEVVFAWPGLGLTTLEATLTRDLPVIQGMVLFIMAIYIAVNYLADMLYVVVDPRIKFSGT